MTKKYLIVLLVGLYSVAAYTGDDLPKGPFCGQKYPNGDNQCCDDRHDDCSHPILDTLCYCDQFCNRTLSHDDCCPDYGPVCRGVPEVEEIFEIPTCKLNGKIYFRSETEKIDCNQCICQYVDERKDAVSWECERNECTNSEDVVNGVWNSGASWRPHNYTQFRNRTLDDSLLYKLGTLPLDANTKRMGAISYTAKEHPIEFDARRHWSSFISPIQDQGWCGSDWAVALTSVASDRFAIQSNGAEDMVLSAQTLLSCNIRGQRGCQGGYIANAWLFATSFGLVDEFCFPYKAQITKCPFKMYSTLLEDGCKPLVAERDLRYRVGPAARLTHEQDIMYDIRSSGPVFAIMEVYQDFFHYRDGVYRRTRYGNQRKNGLHSVRIVGWGEERGDKFWIVANSWGPEWGENGYFRIARGTNEVGIESFVVSASAEVQAASSKK